MLLVHVEAVKSINSAVVKNKKVIGSYYNCLFSYRQKYIVEKVNNEGGERKVVALDQMKSELQTYESPLAEVRDSL